MNSLFSRNNGRSAAPLEPSLWERYILRQQNSPRHVRTSRRITIPGIPSFEHFQDRWEEGHAARRATTDHEAAAEESRPVTPDTPNFTVFGFGDLEDEINGKGSPKASPSSGQRPRHRRNHHTVSPMTRPRLSPFGTPKRSPRFPTSERGQKSHTSSESFEETARRDKARFYARQQANRQQTNDGRRDGRYFSALPRREDFLGTNQPHAPTWNVPDTRTTTELYKEWREACTLALCEKSRMTAIPNPPIPACTSCSNNAIMGRTAVPVTCVHSLEELYRAAKKDSDVRPDAYLKVLKDERNRWHTDRFGACDSKHKANIEEVAQTLFIATNELFEKEKARLEASKAMPVRPRQSESYTNEVFNNPETRAW